MCELKENVRVRSRGHPSSMIRPSRKSRTPLYGVTRSEEWALQAGKVHNLRLAARSLHGRVIAAGEVFSFWANIGRAVRGRGFVEGRELREGCMVPSVGGGLCQLSNALYDVALQAGAEIVERHPHSRRVPGSAAAAGRDATVFWNYVDLRFRAIVEMQIAIELTSNELRVRLLAPAASARNAGSTGANEAFTISAGRKLRNLRCHRLLSPSKCAGLPHGSGVVWMVDAFQPEHDAWMRAQARTAGTGCFSARQQTARNRPVSLDELWLRTCT
jgi:vancomycin resistance protein YoaR